MVWVNVALRHIDENLDDQPVVIDDLRFPNEYHALRKRQFVIVEVQAHRNQRVARLQANGKLQDEAQMEDVSETALDSAVADYAIANTTTPEDLSNILSIIIEREMRRKA